MFIIKTKLTESLLKKSENFSNFREQCKIYLWKYDLNYDKFTITDNDSSLWYLTEYFMKQYIMESFPGAKVESWEDQYDIERLINIVKSQSDSVNDIKYIKEYFYDRRDLKIDYLWKSYYLDVKTAITKLNPNNRRNFLYPVVQANKEWKDYMILCYYVTTDLSIDSFKHLVVVWYTTEEIIKTCNIIKAWEITSHWTTSQIDNYETLLSKHYKSIEDLFNEIRNNW